MLKRTIVAKITQIIVRDGSKEQILSTKLLLHFAKTILGIKHDSSTEPDL